MTLPDTPFCREQRLRGRAPCCAGRVIKAEVFPKHRFRKPKPITISDAYSLFCYPCVQLSVGSNAAGIQERFEHHTHWRLLVRLCLPEHEVTAPAERGAEAHPPRTPRVSPCPRLTWAARHSHPTTDDPHHHRKNSRIATLPTGIHLHGPVPGLFKGKSAQLVRYGLIFEPFNDPAWAKPPHRRPVQKQLCDMQPGGSCCRRGRPCALRTLRVGPCPMSATRLRTRPPPGLAEQRGGKSLG